MVFDVLTAVRSKGVSQSKSHGLDLMIAVNIVSYNTQCIEHLVVCLPAIKAYYDPTLCLRHILDSLALCLLELLNILAARGVVRVRYNVIDPRVLIGKKLKMGLFDGLLQRLVG